MAENTLTLLPKMHQIELVLLTSTIFTVTVGATLAYFTALFGYCVCRRSVVVAPDYAPYAHHGAIVGDVFKHHAVCTHLDVVADCYISSIFAPAPTTTLSSNVG